MFICAFIMHLPLIFARLIFTDGDWIKKLPRNTKENTDRTATTTKRDLIYPHHTLYRIKIYLYVYLLTSQNDGNYEQTGRVRRRILPPQRP